MKHILLVALLCLNLTSIIAQPKKAPQEVKNIEVVGGDRDEHGCIGSAGYVWSELKKECIRSFELDSTKDHIAKLTSTDKTQAMVVLYSKDNSKVELFSALGKRVLSKSKTENSYIYKGKNRTEKLMMYNGKLSYISITKKKVNVLYQ